MKRFYLEDSVYDICMAYPEIKDVLAALGFTDITKPGILGTVGRLMTIPKGARMKGINLGIIIEKLRANGYDPAARSEKMSREINNREYRKNVIRDLLAELHAGKSADDVKAQFKAAFDGVSASEISEAEGALIAGGMPVEEVQRLCDVHAAVFRDSLVEEAPSEDMSRVPGHPIHTLREENRAIEHLIETALKGGYSQSALKALSGALNTHYLHKENLLFPYLERHGITAPPKVMWGVDDEIRSLIKKAAESEDGVDGALAKIDEMIFKEESILFPMLLEHLSPAEWKRIADEMGEIGYALIPAPPVWNPPAGSVEDAPHNQAGSINLPTGVLELRELIRMLDTLPLDITFVDKEDTVKYFSQGAERIFPRTKAVIGRKVAACHPPASVHIVEGILADFKSGKKTHEDFWIKMGGKYIYIRYFAVRGEDGAYLGTLEVTQNIQPLQEITGEKRLVGPGNP